MSEDWNKTSPPPKKIRCTSTDCCNDLHSFKRWRPKKGEKYRLAACRECGAELIDWTRLDKNDLEDVEYTKEALKKEYVRH